MTEYSNERQVDGSEAKRTRTDAIGSRRRFLATAAVAGTGLLTGAVPATADDESEYEGSDETEESETDDEHEEIEEGARIVHLSPDAPVVDVYVDGELWFEDVEPFATQTEYLEYVPGTYTVQFTPAGESPEEAVLEDEVTFEEGRYTVAAVGEVCAVSDEPLRIVNLEDDTRPTEPGHARVRGVHASPDAPSVNVAVDDDSVVENLGFGEAEYGEIPEGEEIIEIHECASREVVERFEVDVEAGHVYTAFAVGYLNPENAPDSAVDNASFALAITEDAVPGER